MQRICMMLLLRRTLVLYNFIEHPEALVSGCLFAGIEKIICLQISNL